LIKEEKSVEQRTSKRNPSPSPAPRQAAQAAAEGRPPGRREGSPNRRSSCGLTSPPTALSESALPALLRV